MSFYDKLYIEFFGGAVLKKYIIVTLICIFLVGCGKNNTGNAKFINEFNTFCTNISEIDGAINNINNIQADEAGLKKAITDLMYYLDMLDDEFKKLANIDFPTEYDGLEKLADEASEYMTEAVRSYHIVYEGDYTESMEEYAKNNYTRAYKRVQYMVNVLNGTTTESGTTTQ